MALLVFIGAPGATGGAGVTRTVDADTTQLLSDVLIRVDATNGPVTVTLLPAAEANKRISIKKVDVSANPVIVQPDLGELLDGQASATLPAAYDSVDLASFGTGWDLL